MSFGRAMTFEALIVARTTNAAGQSAGYRIAGVIENVDGTPTLVGAITKEALGEDESAWDATAEASYFA